MKVPMGVKKVKKEKQPTLRELILNNNKLIMEIKEDVSLIKTLPTFQKEILEKESKTAN